MLRFSADAPTNQSSVWFSWIYHDAGWSDRTRQRANRMRARALVLASRRFDPAEVVRVRWDPREVGEARTGILKRDPEIVMIRRILRCYCGARGSRRLFARSVAFWCGTAFPASIALGDALVVSLPSSPLSHGTKSMGLCWMEVHRPAVLGYVDWKLFWPSQPMAALSTAAASEAATSSSESKGSGLDHLSRLKTDRLGGKKGSRRTRISFLGLGGARGGT